MADIPLKNSNQIQKLDTVITGISTVVNSGNNTLHRTTVPHNLNYQPTILAFTNKNGASYPLPFVGNYTIGVSDIQFEDYLYIGNISSTTFDILWAVTNNSPASIEVRWYILKQSGKA